MEFKDRLKQLRKAKRASLAEVAEIAGVKKATIHKYETGEVVNPKLSMIKDLAEFFGVSPTYLLGWSDDPSKFQKIGLEAITEMEFKLLGNYRDLSMKSRRIVNAIVNRYIELENLVDDEAIEDLEDELK